MKLDAGAVRSIEKILSEEIAQCDQYLGLLFEEQKSVVGLKPDEVARLGQSREAAVENLARLRDQRLKLVADLSADGTMKVSDLVQNRCGPAEKKRLLLLIQKLKQRIAHVEEKSREFNQVVNFSLGLVNGSLSILRSATEPVSKSYDAFGALQEGIQPSSTRLGSSLGKA
jgi:hypothetical protein